MTLDLSEYKNSIYHNPQRYEDQYWWKKNDIEFWKNIYDKHIGTRILELGCGTGRLGLPLLRCGAHYTGVEISKEFCVYAEEKIVQSGFSPNIVNQDFRDFNLGEKYDIIFIGFNTFLHILTDSDAISFLKAVKSHMHSESRFYIDIFVPDPSFLYRTQKRVKNLEYIDSQTNQTIYIDEVCNYDQSTEINKVTWIYYSKDSDKEEKYQFTMRMYYPDTMNRIITDVGFHINQLWGDHEFNEFNEYSELQIYECQL